VNVKVLNYVIEFLTHKWDIVAFHSHWKCSTLRLNSWRCN